MKFVYEIGGNGNDGRCRFELQDMAECSYDWGCKCQDSRNNTYTCLRSVTQTEDSLFCQFSDDKNTEELYDLHTDPYQLHNLATAASADLAAAAAATGHEHHSQNTRLVFPKPLLKIGSLSASVWNRISRSTKFPLYQKPIEKMKITIVWISWNFLFQTDAESFSFLSWKKKVLFLKNTF